MTIEEYLKKSAEEIENTIPKGDNCDGNIYLAGKVDAYRELLGKLSEFEHEVTLKEAKDFCAKQEEEADVDENPCEHCPMSIEVQYFADSEPSIECGQITDILPRDWNIAAIERRMKEARND